MKKTGWLLLAAALLVAALLGGGLCVMLYLHCVRSPHMEAIYTTKSEVVRLVCTVARETLYDGKPERPLQLPRGDVKSLYAWLQKRCETYTASRRTIRWGRLVDNKAGSFKDIWGRELVYRFPSERRHCMFDLYSMGPNGVDENGQGDDIASEQFTEFAYWSDLFTDGMIDSEWVRANLDQLQRDPGSGKIIGVPARGSTPSGPRAP